MSSEAYFQALMQILSPLTSDERAEAVAFFQDYAEDGGLTDGDAITKALGTPQQLGRQILADYAIKSSTASGSAASPKANARQIKTIVLAILSAPMTVPVAIALFVIVLALLIVIAAVSLAILLVLAGATGLGLGVGAFSIFAGLFLLAHPMVALSYVGLGIAAIGVGLFLIPLLKWTTQGMFNVVARFFRWIYRHIRKQHLEVTQL
ncbi:hypothetical protein FD51_GL000919 [Lacticaseibacillus zeae DSM 20178 = KCTC 3804]|uniref:DUF1700 domain-containing protein n=2 Tax=Lacticaseibacillus zeae TaxID=57037 RepID=A0A5R8LRN9_LACZE|nr:MULTISPECIES: DUF1700 domain-containing protein [Lacticaseibacillus]KRK11769.1 hypothetical protein FD51_GL000919 [Lacticaseibacillus zeae DSM 20178 = KCTC 3804]MDE3283393.1 DUF1700 domain-containing protein [Lacticaseibacillus casei]OLS04142.1 hypothetical protein AUQ39_14430 [Lacticaseibacillus casei]QVI31550.1 DUF1700 domain-containing protein [Lacticaseibacillus zeae]TLF39887.1 DUF1700 domain-containing protein [Lacticaseibacillus zeae]